MSSIIATAHETTHALAQKVLTLIPDPFPGDPQYEKVLEDAETKHKELREQAGIFLKLYEITETRNKGKMETSISADDAVLLVHWLDNLIGFDTRAKYHEQKVRELSGEDKAKPFHVRAAKLFVDTRESLKTRLKRLFEEFGFLKPDQPSVPGQIARLKDSMSAAYRKLNSMGSEGVRPRDLGMINFKTLFGIK